MIISVKKFDVNYFKQFKPIKRGKGNFKKNKKQYLDVITAFDIETTRLADIEQAFMYIWQFQVGEYTVIGRTWPEWFEFLEKIKEVIKPNWLVLYVHNLAFEFSFLKGWYDFDKDEVFSTDPRRVLKCDMFDTFEYRCSYFLTNMSLGAFTNKMQVENKKLSGLEFDYEKVRYPWTLLTDKELEYCVNDVKGLVQALEKSFKADGDNVATVPLTSTGYVRRDTQKAMQQFNHKQLRALLPTPKIQILLDEAFRGGNTHGNRWISNIIIENVRGADSVSHYPYTMLNCRFPMSPFTPVINTSVENIKRLLNINKHALLFRIDFVDIELIDMFEGCPYLSRDKCRNIANGLFDNGRIIQAGSLSTTLTDLDFRIVLGMYKWKACKIYDCYKSRYKMLPKMLRDVVLKYYRVKTELKGDEENAIYYQKNKERLNACYGMTAQSPIKQSIDFIDNEFVVRNEPFEKLLAESNKKAFLSYAWGVWVTAWARYRLQEVINLAGHNFVYCDTDSVKYIGDLDLSEFNNERKYESEVNDAYAVDNKGVVHYMGVFESEGYELPNRFSTMGAKKYVFEDKNKNLTITIAGVNKKLGAKELGKIENFKEGFIFTKAGGTESVFNDNVDFEIEKEGHKINIRDNVVIRPSTYTLGLTAEYKAVLSGLVKIKYAENDIDGLFVKTK